MQTVDDLNLKFGVLNQDVRPRNCLVDLDTDNILLADFGMAAMVGQNIDERGGVLERILPSIERPLRNDVKDVMMFLHEIVTRSAFYTDFLDPAI